MFDNKTNFIAANKELCQLICKGQKVQAYTTSKGIKWTFNPSYVSHLGGAFEIMIKSANRAIIADIKDEELMTAFCETEAPINSRPLAYVNKRTIYEKLWEMKLQADLAKSGAVSISIQLKKG